MPQTLTQGQNFTDTAGRTGIVNFDVNTGKKLNAGQTTTFNQPTQNISPVTPINPNVNPTINAGTIGNVQPVNLPTPQGVSVQPPEITNFAETEIANQQSQKTDNQEFEEKSIYKLLEGTQSLLGESAMLQQQQEQAGVFAKEAEYRKISDQVRIRQAQTQQEYAAINKSPMSFAARSGYEAAVRAASESEIGALNAQAQAVAGDYEMAVNTAQRAVDAKYKPEKEKIAMIKAQLEAIKPLLDADQKKQLAERERLIKLEERKYDEKIDFEKNLANMTMTALAAGAPQSVIEASKQAKTTLEAAQILGKYSPETLKYELLKEQIKTEKTQRSKIYTDIAKTKSETGSNGSKPLTADEKKANTASVNLVGLLDDYAKEIEGVSFLQANSAAKRTAINSLKGRITAEYKQAKQLGTLDAGVQKLIDSIIPNPGSLSISSLNNKAQVKAINDFKASFLPATPEGQYVERVIPMIQKSNSTTINSSTYANGL